MPLLSLRLKVDYCETLTAGRPYVEITEDWTLSARALSTRLRLPRTKLIVDASTYEVLGRDLIGLESSTMIYEIIMLMHVDIATINGKEIGLILIHNG